MTAKCAATPTTKYTVVTDEAYYAVHQSSSNTLCAHMYVFKILINLSSVKIWFTIFRNGDCYDDATNKFTCPLSFETCFYFASNNVKLSNCQDRIAKYLHVVYSCVPCKTIFN